MSVGWAVALVAIALLIVAGPLWAGGLLRRANEEVVWQTRSGAVLDEVHVGVLSYRRLDQLYLASGEPELVDARDDARRELEALLDRAGAYVEGPRERAHWAEASEALEEYFAYSEGLEPGEADLARVIQQGRPFVDRVVAALESLGALNESAVARAQAETRRVITIATVSGSAIGLFLLLALIASLRGARGLVVRPLVELDGALERFRTGDTAARVSVGRAARDLDQVGRTFNQMADAIVHQRDRQLEFLAGVAHDVRNPLLALKLGIDTVANRLRGAPEARTVALLDRQIDRLSRMVDDLIDATRIEAGQLELHPRELDLRESAREVVLLYAPTATEHELVLDEPDEPVLVEADPLRIEQVASNLVTNAIKFSPGGGRVVVRVARAGGSAVLEVVDRGIGIAAADIPTLFAPFRRHAPEVAHGAGLGLSVVRRIVAAHGGTIEVESVPGAGSTFRVRLPLAPTADPGK